MAEVVVVGHQRAQRRIDADLERRVVHSDRDQPPVVIPHPIRPRAAARQQQCRQGDRQNDWPPAAWTARSVIAVMRYPARNAVERQFLDSLHNPLAPLGVHTMIRASGLCARTGMGWTTVFGAGRWLIVWLCAIVRRRQAKPPRRMVWDCSTDSGSPRTRGRSAWMGRLTHVPQARRRGAAGRYGGADAARGVPGTGARRRYRRRSTVGSGGLHPPRARQRRRYGADACVRQGSGMRWVPVV